MDLASLPNEVISLIMEHIDELVDVKSLALVSKKFYNLSLTRMWSFPTFGYKRIDEKCFLEKIAHLPIRQLRTMNFDSYTPNEIVKIIPQLQCLVIDTHIIQHNFKPEDFCDVRIPIDVHTLALDWIEEKSFCDEVIEMCEKHDVNWLSINHTILSSNGVENYRFTLSQFMDLAVKVPISLVAVNCLDIDGENFSFFVELLAVMRCEVEIPMVREGDDRYLFTVKDLE